MGGKGVRGASEDSGGRKKQEKVRWGLGGEA